MKKIICLLILFTIGGYIFFAGWTQIRVKPEMCGVVRSRLTGVNEKPIVPGVFSWNWECVVPNNATIQQFEVKPYNCSKIISGTVSSGDAFSAGDLLGYKFSYGLTLSYTPESIINLIKENKVSNQEDFYDYLDNAANYICQNATSYYLSKLNFDTTFRPEYIKRDELIKGINYYNDFPDIDIVIISLNDYKLPNYSLYNHMMMQSGNLSAGNNENKLKEE